MKKLCFNLFQKKSIIMTRLYINQLISDLLKIASKHIIYDKKLVLGILNI